MTQSAPSFYLDESLSPRIAVQLKLRGIDAIRGPLGDDDPAHLSRAREMGRVVCTADDDFLKIQSSGAEHCGIIKGENPEHSIGDWVKFLVMVHGVYSSEELQGMVMWLFPLD